jgi:hypothetical protein
MHEFFNKFQSNDMDKLMDLWNWAMVELLDEMQTKHYWVKTVVDAGLEIPAMS